MPYVITFDVTKFREMFPEFANPIQFPDARLQMYWDQATCYISDLNCGYLNGSCRETALYLMTAHLTALSVLISQGETPGYEQAASIDKISVTLTPPPNRSQFDWWLNNTPYGAQLLSMLSVKAVGGWWAGGLPETIAFRKVGGVFGGIIF